MQLSNNRPNPSDRSTQPTPVVQYVRTSAEAQQYSIDNQKAALKQYAASHGLIIVKTYSNASSRRR